jgi:hypothetical protein
MRWYEFRMSGGNPTVFQQGTYAPDSTFGGWARSRWTTSATSRSAAPQSSSTTHPSIRFTGAGPGRPVEGTIEAETTVFTGGGSQTGGLALGRLPRCRSTHPITARSGTPTNTYRPTAGSWNTRLRPPSSYPGCTTGGNTVTVKQPWQPDNAPAHARQPQMTATDSQAGQTFTWSATGLPNGLSDQLLDRPDLWHHPSTPTPLALRSPLPTPPAPRGSASFTWTIT